MFWRDKAIDPVAEAAKMLAASRGHHAETSTKFARSMMTDEQMHPHSATTSHAPTARIQTAPPAAGAAPDARVQRFKEAIAKQGKTLTPQQLAALERLGDSQKAVLEHIGKRIAWIPKIIFVIVLLFIFSDFIPAIFAFLKSFID